MRKSLSHIYFCPDHYTEIRNYDLALKDDFKGWVCHHINGEEFSKEWLIQNNLYYNRTDPHEFVFLPTRTDVSKRTGIPTHKQVHNRTNNGKIACEKQASKLKGKPGHKHTDEEKKHLSEVLTGRTFSKEHRQHISETVKDSMRNVKSEFSKKFRAKYGISKRRNLHLYNTEAYFYRTHGYCSWECVWIKENLKK